MGLFDFFKKKTTSTDNSIIKDFERALIQEVALTMFSMKITKQPALSFFHDDQGIFEGIYISRTTDPQFLEIANEDFTTYLMVIGCHALGAAAYVALCQLKYKKSISEFNENEMKQIALDMHETDAYELAINALGYSPTGNNKRCLDHIVVTANTAAQKLVGNKIKEKEYQKVYMQVLYNAGVTLLYGR